jgi:hypothetical protein
MKMRQLFNLFQDVQDLLSMFENVSSTPQMVSNLERMRRGQAPDDLFNIVQSLRLSLTEALEANLELGGDLSEATTEEAGGDLTDELLKETNWNEEGAEVPASEDIHVAVTPAPLEKPGT